MSGDIIREWNFWLASMLTGACMAFLYDILRLFRRLVRHGRLAVDLEDIVYWSACFGASFVLLYYGNNGVIRFAAVVGAAAGMAVYAATAGRVLIKAGYFVIDRAKKFIFYQKCRLTNAVFRLRIVVYFKKIGGGIKKRLKGGSRLWRRRKTKVKKE